MAGATGLEPATSGVTGRRSNQLSYAPAASTRAGTPTPFGRRTSSKPDRIQRRSAFDRARRVSLRRASLHAVEALVLSRHRACRAVVGDDGLEPPTLSV